MYERLGQWVRNKRLAHALARLSEDTYIYGWVERFKLMTELTSMQDISTDPENLVLTETYIENIDAN